MAQPVQGDAHRAPSSKDDHHNTTTKKMMDEMRAMHEEQLHIFAVQQNTMRKFTKIVESKADRQQLRDWMKDEEPARASIARASGRAKEESSEGYDERAYTDDSYTSESDQFEGYTYDERVKMQDKEVARQQAGGHLEEQKDFEDQNWRPDGRVGQGGVARRQEATGGRQKRKAPRRGGQEIFSAHSWK